MRGPADDAAAAPARPPGGKALLRLLLLLGSAGYEAAAQATLDIAVPGDARDELRTGVEASIALPRPAARAAPDEDGRRGAAEDVARTHAEAASRLIAVPATGPRWSSLGPEDIPRGQTYGASRVHVTGRVAAVAVDPSDAEHLLVGAANGGVWESRDGGDTWAPRSDFAPTLAVGALAFDPSDPSIVYCGTGEGNWWWFLGAGLLRSTDGGTTWSTHCTAPFVGRGFYDLVVDPADGQHLLAATTSGLYVSTDGGTNWTPRRFTPTFSLAIAPDAGPDAEILAGSSDGVWRSTDGGTTWTAVRLPGSPGFFTRLAVALGPSSTPRRVRAPEPVPLGVAYAWGAGTLPYLWRRPGRDQTWAEQTTPAGIDIGQAWYDWFLAISPGDPDQIYCGAITVYRGTRADSANWDWLDIATKASGDSIHPDSHAIAFAPGAPDTIYVGTDGGLFRSRDRGVTWAHRNNGLVISEFEYIASNLSTSRWLIGGTQDNGTERWLGSSTWEHVGDGDGGDCDLDNTDPDTVYRTSQNMYLERSIGGGAWGTWTPIPPPVPDGELRSFYAPFECAGDTIAMTGAALYVSRDTGTHWTRLAFPTSGTGTALYAADPDTMYVGLLDGRVFSATWLGSAWRALKALSTPRANGAVSDVVQLGSRLWVTCSTVGGGLVFRSDDGGASWDDKTADLPNLSITSIAVDPESADRAWVSASLGVYETTDGGQNWHAFSAGLPHAYVGDLSFHRHARVLRAGTRNRGVWEIPVDGWMTAPECGIQWTGRLTANQSRTWRTTDWPATWHVIWTVMPTTAHAGAPQLSWTVEVERTSAQYVAYSITVQNLTTSIVDLEGRYCILSRY